MGTVAALTQRLRDDRTTQILLARYLAIGGFVFCIDMGAFQAFIRLALPLGIATSLSFLLAVAAHFTLNRYLNFRRFDRPALQQAGTYAVVAACGLVVQNAIVFVGVDALNLPPALAKLIGIAVNVPVGFLGHRYLTFGAGIVATLQRYHGGSSGTTR